MAGECSWTWCSVRCFIWTCRQSIAIICGPGNHTVGMVFTIILLSSGFIACVQVRHAFEIKKKTHTEFTGKNNNKNRLGSMDPLSSSPFTFLAAMSWDITFNQDSLSSGIGAFHPQSIPLENLLPAHFLNTIITPVVPHPPGPISTTDFPLPVPISNAGSQGVQTLPPILTPSSLPRTAARKSLKANVRKRRRSVSTPAVRAPEEDNCCICLEFRGLFSVTTLYQNHRQSLAYGHL